MVLVFRRQDGEWRLLLATASDPVTWMAVDDDVPRVAARLATRSLGKGPIEPAVLLAPADGQEPKATAGDRFGAMVWRPSQDEQVVAELIEFAYDGTARIFLRLRTGEPPSRSSLSAGRLWGRKILWRWRVWSIDRTGEVSLSESRSFVR